MEINGLTLELPKQPPKKKILNHDLKKADQFWVRQELPLFMEDYDPFDATEAQIEYIQEELDRIENGVWVYINGEATWLTGSNYFFLQWFRLQEGIYPSYRDVDRRFFYFYEAAYRYKQCLGVIRGKYRRMGASSQGSAILLRMAITETNSLYGIISKSGLDASSLFSDMIVYGFKSLPQFILPQSQGTDKSVKELVIAKQSERMTKDKRIVGKAEGLNNKVIWGPTSLNTFDGKRLRFLFKDESGKWPKDVPSYRYWNVVKRCLQIGTKRVGFAYVPSTVNDKKDGGEEFEKLWKASDHTAKDFKGFTSSGLFKFFNPCYEGYCGFIGKYGESIIENPTKEQQEWLAKDEDCPDPTIGAKQYHDRVREQLKDDPDALSEYIRQHPYNEKEQFYSKAKGSLFNPLLINQQLDYIEDNKIPMRIGRFYKDERNGEIKFMDDADGMWHILYLPTEANQHKYVYGKKVPLNKHLYAIGVDTYASSEGASFGDGSMGVAFVRRAFVATDPNNSDMPVAMMQYRPKQKELFFEQCAYAAQYYSCLAGFEQTISDYYDFFVGQKLDGYLLYTPEPLRSDRSKIVKSGIPATSVKSREYHTNMLINDFLVNYQKIYFKELLIDMLRFDPEERTISDWCMSYGYSIITQESSTVRDIVIDKPTSSPLVKTYKIF